MNELEKRKVSGLKAKKASFLEDLLSEALEGAFIDEREFEKIRNELRFFFTAHIIKNKTPSIASVSRERFDALVKEGMFFLNLALSRMEAQDALDRVLSFDFETIYSEGVKRGLSLFEKLKKDYLRARGNLFLSKNAFFIDFISVFLPSFIEKAEDFEEDIDALIFLSGCDDEFDFEYPVCLFDEDAAGIEKAASYVSSFKIENDFLSLFDPSLFESDFPDDLFPDEEPDPFLGEMDFSLEGEFLPTLLSSLKLILCAENPFSLKLSKEGEEHIRLLFEGKSDDEIAALLIGALGTLKELAGFDDEHCEYYEKCLKKHFHN